jgi:hypothetical protein
MAQPDIRMLARSALNELDRLQCDADIEMKQNLEQVMQNLIDMRNELIEPHRSRQQFGDWLAATNAILSCLFGTEFPHGGLQRQRISETREALRNLLRQAN